MKILASLLYFFIKVWQQRMSWLSWKLIPFTVNPSFLIKRFHLFNMHLLNLAPWRMEWTSLLRDQQAPLIRISQGQACFTAQTDTHLLHTLLQHTIMEVTNTRLYRECCLSIDKMLNSMLCCPLFWFIIGHSAKLHDIKLLGWISC